MASLAQVHIDWNLPGVGRERLGNADHIGRNDWLVRRNRIAAISIGGAIGSYWRHPALGNARRIGRRHRLGTWPAYAPRLVARSTRTPCTAACRRFGWASHRLLSNPKIWRRSRADACHFADSFHRSCATCAGHRRAHCRNCDQIGSLLVVHRLALPLSVIP